MIFAARKPHEPSAAAIDSALIDSLNEAVVAAIRSVPNEIVLRGVRKMLRLERPISDGDLSLLLDLAGAHVAVLHLFTPSLSGVRPIDRLARAAAGKPEARALTCVANSRFRIFHVEAFGAGDRATAKDCVTGATFDLVTEGLDPLLINFDVATRLCPIGGGVFWPMGPLTPVGPHGAGLAARFPTRPGKGLINEAAVAAQIGRDYIRAGAPFGIDFGVLKHAVVTLSFVDEELADYAEAVREFDAGPVPSGDLLSQLRSLTSARRLAMALNCSMELAAQGADDGAAIYLAAARIFVEVLAERARVGSRTAVAFNNLRAEVSACFAPQPLPAEVAALLETLLAEAGRRAPKPKAQEDGLARVIERIRALRQKTVELGCTEQEALRAAEKVAELLERYGLTLSEVELRKQTCEGFGFDTGRKTTGPVDDCLRAIAHFCDCRIWSEISANGHVRQVFFGLPADIEAVRCLKDLLIEAFEVETEAFKRGDFCRAEPSSGRRAMVKSFQIGLGGGISGKLMDLKAAREQAAALSTGRDLVVVKRSIVDEEMEKLGMAFTTRRKRRSRVISDAFEQGVAAAHRFQINEKLG